MPGTAASMSYPQLPLLSPEQQNLLLAALSSNKRNAMNKSRPAPEQDAQLPATDGIDPSSLFDATDKKSYSSPQYHGVFGDGLFPNFADNSTNFDVEFPTSANDLLDDSPDFSSDTPADPFSGDAAEKRKSPEDEDEDDDGDNKRQEGDDKVAKKPGRKLITAEPTTKRKAQNRAAQRAFRERKEKHLRDLEVKVTELEKSSESTTHENGLLKVQVDRLQTELREYRKRLSASGNGLGSSPPPLGLSSYPPKRASSGSSSDFQFDFAKFGGTASNQSSSSAKVSTLQNQTSQSSDNSGRSASPKGIDGAFSSIWTPADNVLADIGSDSNSGSTTQVNDILPNYFVGSGASEFGVSDFDTSSNQQSASSVTSTSERSVQRQKSTGSSNMSDANSPATPSISPNGASSSCCTSPDAQNYLGDLTKTPASTLYGLNEPLGQPTLPSNSTFDFQNFDWLSNQNGGQFDPVLFGDYRESQDAVVGGGDFSSGFFEDPYGLSDQLHNDFNFIQSTSNNVNGMNAQTANVAAAPKSPAAKVGATLLDQVKRCREGETNNDDGLVMPGDKRREMMTAQSIWTELQTCPKFMTGDLDIDTLCSELSAKARCSESGMAVPKAVVEKALWRLAGVPDGGDQIMATLEKASQFDEMKENSTSSPSGLRAQW